MAEKINWLTSMDEAITQAKTEDKLILLDFFNPNWVGCIQMDTVTNPQTQVADFVDSTLIPLQLEAGGSDWAEKFTIRWTPSLLVINADLKEHHRTVGFLNPEELIVSLLLGCAKSSFDGSQFADMAKPLNEILTTYPKSFAAPEAVYLRGVANFLLNHDVAALKEIHRTISSDYPNSEWLMRAEPYKLL